MVGLAFREPVCVGSAEWFEVGEGSLLGGSVT